MKKSPFSSRRIKENRADRRDVRARSLRFEPLEERALLSATSDFFAPLPLPAAPELVDAAAPEAVPAESAAPEIEFVAVPEEVPESNAVSNSIVNYNAHDLAVAKRCGVEPYDSWRCSWNESGRLTSLQCSYDLTGRLDVSGCVALQELNCAHNTLTSLDASGCVALQELGCYNNALTSLNVSGCVALKWLDCRNNALTSLNVSKNTALNKMHCENNALTSLDVSKNTALYGLDCYNNALTSLDVSGCVVLRNLYCENNALTSLDVSGCVALQELNCENNALTSLDVSKNTALYGLDCYNNALTSLDVSKNTALNRLQCHNNALTSLDVSKNTALNRLRCHNKNLTTVIVPKKEENTTALRVDLRRLDASFDEIPTNLEYYYFDSNGKKTIVAQNEYYHRITITSESTLPIYCDFYESDASEPFQTVVISYDAYNQTDVENLRAFLNQGKNGKLVDAKQPKKPAFDSTKPETFGVEWKLIDGEYCLTEIAWPDYNLTGKLDLSKCANLKKVDVSGNKLTEINVDSCAALEEIDASDNLNDSLKKFSANDCGKLQTLDCSDNALTTFSAKNCVKLETLDCEQNKLTELDVSTLSALKTLRCGANPLENLEIDRCANLETLECWSAKFKRIDVSENAALKTLVCYNDKLQAVYVADDCAGTLEIDLTRFDDDGQKIAADYRWTSLLENGAWQPNGSGAKQTRGTQTFQAYVGGRSKTILLPLYGVVYDSGANEIRNTVRVVGTFFTLPEILLKQNDFDRWRSAQGKTATLIDPLRFNPKTGKSITQYLDLPYQIDRVWIAANGLDAYGLVRSEDAKKTSLFSALPPVLLFPGTDTRLNQTGWALADLYADVDPRGIAYNQYLSVNWTAKSWLATRGETPNVYGYSLGAALAQRVICDYYGRLNDVELFNVPGIAGAEAEKYRRELTNNLSFHISSGDLVAMAGESMLPGGTVYLYSYSTPNTDDVFGYLDAKHLSPLSVPFAFAGNTNGAGLKYVKKSSSVETITSKTFGSYWFHYDDAEYSAWRSIFNLLTADILAIRGTTEHGRIWAKSLALSTLVGAGELTLGAILLNPILSAANVGAGVANLAKTAASLYAARQNNLTLPGGWKLLQINEKLTSAFGKLVEGATTVVDPSGLRWDAKLKYDRYSLGALSVDVQKTTRLGLLSDFYLENATLEMSPTPIDVYDASAVYSLDGPGKISYQYRPVVGKNVSLATVGGTVRVGQTVGIGQTTRDAWINVGNGFATGRNGSLSISSKTAANGRFDVSLFNLFEINDARIELGKRRFGTREAVVVSGTTKYEISPLSVDAEYFGPDDWKIVLTDVSSGKVYKLTPSSPNFHYDPPCLIADFGDVEGPSIVASAAVFETKFSAPEFSNATAAETPTGILRFAWSNATADVEFRFKNGEDVYSEAEMIERGYLQRLAAFGTDVSKSFLCYLNANALANWTFASDSTLENGSIALYQTELGPQNATLRTVDATVANGNELTVSVEVADVDALSELEFVLTNEADGATVPLATVAPLQNDADADGRRVWTFALANWKLPDGDYRLTARLVSEKKDVSSAVFAVSTLARLELETSNVAFGNVAFDSETKTAKRTVSLKNVGERGAAFSLAPQGTAGTNDFYVSGVYADGSEVELSGIELRPGEELELTFVFAPTSAVGRAVAVDLLDENGETVWGTLNLSGLGVASDAPTAAISASATRVQEGCAVFLSGENSFDPSGTGTAFRWNVSDLEKETTNDAERLYYIATSPNDLDVRLQTIDGNGVESDVALQEILVEKTAPTIDVKKTTFGAGNVVRFEFDVQYFSSRRAFRWALDWGDGAKTTSDSLSSSMTAAHCYASDPEAPARDITLTLTDVDGADAVFNIGTYGVPEPTEPTNVVVDTRLDVVDESDGRVSLREALNLAGTGSYSSVVVFDDSLKGKTILLNGNQLNIAKSVTIDASRLQDAQTGAPGIQINGAGKTRVFGISGPIDVVLNGLNVVNGYVDGMGGGICNNLANLTILNSNVSNNYATFWGGGIHNEGSLSLVNVKFTENQGKYGGAVSSNKNASFLKCDVSNNSATNGAGGIFIGTGCATIVSTVVSHNTAPSYGGGIANQGTLSVVNSLIVENVAVAEKAVVFSGGGIVNQSNLTITNSTVAGNSALKGGGLYVGNAAYSCTKIFNSIIACNVALNEGTDVYIEPRRVCRGNNNLSSFFGWTSPSGNNAIYSKSKALFVDRSQGDYSLVANSQATDAGDNRCANAADLNEQSFDLSGKARIINNKIDLGAYEFQGTVLSTALFPQANAAPNPAAFDGDERDVPTSRPKELPAVDNVKIFEADALWDIDLSDKSPQLNKNDADLELIYNEIFVDESWKPLEWERFYPSVL